MHALLLQATCHHIDQDFLVPVLFTALLLALRAGVALQGVRTLAQTPQLDRGCLGQYQCSV